MIPGRRLAAAALLAFGGAALAIAGIRLLQPDGGRAAPPAGSPLATALAAARPAPEPFGGFDAARVALGRRCLRVLVADEDGEREQGLRGVAALGSFDGMLFVYGSDGRREFTMAGTRLALDIGFYAVDGRPVGRERMVPCAGRDGSCPTYGAGNPFRYALEAPAGGLPAGGLGPCA